MPGWEHGDAGPSAIQALPRQNPTNMGRSCCRRGQACRGPLRGTPGRGQAGRCQAGLPGGREEHRSPPEEGGRAWKRLLLPERRDLLCCAKRQGSLRAAFVQGEKMMAAGSAASQLPAQAEPVTVFSPLKVLILGGGSRVAPEDPTARARSLLDHFSHSHTRYAPEPGYIMDGGRVQPLREPTPLCPSSPSPLPAPCPAAGGQILNSRKQQPDKL